MTVHFGIVNEAQYKKFMEVGDIDCALFYADGTFFINCHIGCKRAGFLRSFGASNYPDTRRRAAAGCRIEPAASRSSFLFIIGSYRRR